MKINNQENSYKKPTIGACVGGVLAGSAVSKQVISHIRKISPKISTKMDNISNSLSVDEVVCVDKAINNIMDSSGLTEKGIEIIKANAKNAKEIEQILKYEYDNHFLYKYMPEAKKKKAVSKLSKLFVSGTNACHLFNSKKIILPEKGLILSAFHEIGHAVNANFGKVSKVIPKCKPVKLLAMPILWISLFKTKKSPNQKSEGTIDKATTFVKENAGKLTFAVFLPGLINEGMASIKGFNCAKKLLTPELLKKVSKLNLLGLATYIVTAVASSLGVLAAVKVKDAIAKPELIK